MLEDVKDEFGHAIDTAQAGSKHVYTIKLAGWVYVLHCFQKQSTVSRIARGQFRGVSGAIGRDDA